MPELESSGLLLFAVLGFFLAVAFLLAQLRLFSIDKTLKAILEELRAEREVKAARSFAQPAPAPKQGAIALLDD